MLSEVLPIFTGGGYDKLLQGNRPQDLRWRDAIRRLVRSVPGRRIVIWCHEDVPLIWPEIVRLAGKIPADAPLSGALVYMQEILGDSGLAMLQEALGGRDQLSVQQRREIYARILADHAPRDAMEQEVALPGWTQDMVDEITDLYRSDVAEIAVLPGVEFVLP